MNEYNPNAGDNFVMSMAHAFAQAVQAAFFVQSAGKGYTWADLATFMAYSLKRAFRTTFGLVPNVEIGFHIPATPNTPCGVAVYLEFPSNNKTVFMKYTTTEFANGKEPCEVKYTGGLVR